MCHPTLTTQGMSRPLSSISCPSGTEWPPGCQITVAVLQCSAQAYGKEHPFSFWAQPCARQPARGWRRWLVLSGSPEDPAAGNPSQLSSPCLVICQANRRHHSRLCWCQENIPTENTSETNIPPQNLGRLDAANVPERQARCHFPLLGTWGSAVWVGHRTGVWKGAP